jgi:hypothetical protein
MKLKFAITAMATALLSACGGGGSSSGADAIDKYIGTWKGTCDTRGDILQSVDNKTTNAVYSVNISKLSATTANVAVTTTVYGNSDTACTGTPLGSIVKTGLNTNSETSGASGITSNYGQNVWTYDANVTLAGGQKVDQFTYSESKLSANANANITAGQIKINTANFPAETGKSIAYFVDANTVVFNGNETAAGYPTVLRQDKYSTYTKQ